MLSLAQIRELHVELTERCNAECPMCGRRDRGGKLNPNLENREIRLKEFRKFFPQSFLRQLSSMRLCGNFGDPAAARDTIAICEHARAANPRLALRMNSNGGIRSKDWWYQLARLYRGKNDSVQFGIDGLDDTHSLYRRGTNFKTVLRNAEAFIRGGGNAHWVFLVFEHNEHQVADAERLASELGFSQFTVKATKRFLGAQRLSVSETAPVCDNDGDELYQLRLPKDRRMWNETLLNVQRAGGTIDSTLDTTRVRCKALDRRGLFVSAEGLVFPCCWLGAARFPNERGTQTAQLDHLVHAAGGCDRLSLHARNLEDVFESQFFDLVEASWGRPSVAEGRLQVCARVCGEKIEAFEKQFVRDTALVFREKQVEFC